MSLRPLIIPKVNVMFMFRSRFAIADATPKDSGNYTCKPSNAVQASIQVFVSNTRGK